MSNGIDPMMREVVEEWNKIPGLTTFESCQSHWSDDKDFDECEQVEHFVEQGDVYPYIAFRIHDPSVWDVLMLSLPDREELTIEFRTEVGETNTIWYLGVPYLYNRPNKDERERNISILLNIAKRVNNPGSVGQ